MDTYLQMKNTDTSTSTNKFNELFDTVAIQDIRNTQVKQTLLTNEIDKAKDTIVADSIIALYELATDHSTPAHVRVQAANTLLDRYLGKPVVKEEIKQDYSELIRPIVINHVYQNKDEQQ
jgi:uncharacterized protein (UPF0147 family)